MKSRISRLTVLGLIAAASFLPASALLAQQTPAKPEAPASGQITENDIINGVMDITFNTRTQKDSSGDLVEGSAAMGVKDIYKVNLTVAKTTQFTGEITRQPNLYTSMLQRKKQDAALSFNLDLSVLNPSDLKQKKSVGKWVGYVPIDPVSGAYRLGDGDSDGESRLRIDILASGRAPAFKDFFYGRMVGKAEKKDGLASYTFKRLVGNKTVQVVVKKSDPMKFENVVLGKGPSENYPSTRVNGRLDYDYETGNWYTDGIRFGYTLNGQEIEDVVTGSIKWVEDPDRASNGKGYYEFNLRFNEEKNRSLGDEGAAFENLSDEEAFFFVDNSIPSLTGRISYVDTMGSGADAAPSSSKVTYNLNANKLTKQQVMNFFKLWMIGVGPTNDE